MARKAADKIEMELKPIEIKRARIRIKGDSPLIMHAWDAKVKRMILEKEMGSASVKKHPIKNPVNDFITSMYWLSNMPELPEKDITPEESQELFDKAVESGATWGFPVTGIKAAAVSAAFRNGMSKDKVSLQGSFFIEGTGKDQLVEIKGCVPNIREDMVKVGMGTADIRHRGEFDDWYADVVIHYNVNGKMSLEDISNIINLGGFSCGIGEWRAEKGGTFGAFHVTEVESLDD